MWHQWVSNIIINAIYTQHCLSDDRLQGSSIQIVCFYVKELANINIHI